MILLKNPTKEAWLKARAEMLNSTESSALFGANPYTSEFNIWHTKKGNIEDTFTPTERTIIGTHVESGIADSWAEVTGWTCEPFKDYLADPDTRIGSSFDYMISSGPYEGYLLEIKNVDYIVYANGWSDEEAPAHIEIQGQHQCMVSKAPGVVFLACVGGNSLKWFPRERDDEMIAAIRKRIAKFWDDFDNNIEPQPNYQKDVEALKQLYSRATPKKVFDASADEEISAHLANYKQWGDDIKRLKAMQESVKAEIFSKADDASKVIANGFTVSCGVTKDTEAKTLTVTEDMIGQEIELSKGRKGYRQFRVTEKTNNE